jgi:hypothetical protein
MNQGLDGPRRYLTANHKTPAKEDGCRGLRGPKFAKEARSVRRSASNSNNLRFRMKSQFLGRDWLRKARLLVMICVVIVWCLVWCFMILV